MKIKVEIDKLGKEKLIKQIKDKLRNLKNLYKQVKNNNKNTGRSPVFSTYYQDFDEILCARDVISLQHSREASVIKKISNTEPDNEDTGGNICILLDHSYLSIKRHLFYRAPLVATSVSCSSIYNANN